MTMSVARLEILKHELDNLRHPYLAPLSDPALEIPRAYQVMQETLQTLVEEKNLWSADSKYFLSEFLALPVDKLLAEYELQNTSQQQLFENQLSIVKTQNSEIQSGNFDNFKASFNSYLKKSAILSMVSAIRSPTKIVQIKVDIPKVKAIVNEAFEIFKDSNGAAERAKWDSLQFLINSIIKDFDHQPIPVFNRFALLQINNELYLKSEIMNLVLFAKISNVTKHLNKALELLDVLATILKEPKQLEVLAVVALRARSQDSSIGDSPRDVFLVKFASAIFRKLSENGFSNQAFAIIRRYMKTRLLSVNNSKLSSAFNGIYISGKTLVPVDDSVYTIRQWALKTWDFILHLGSKHSFSEIEQNAIARNFEGILSFEKNYIDTYDHFIVLLSNFVTEDWAQDTYFKHVWLQSVAYRLKYPVASAEGFDQFLNLALSKHTNALTNNYLIMQKLENAILNGQHEHFTVVFNILSETAIRHVKELLSDPAFLSFDRVLRIVYLQNHEKLSESELKEMSYVGWLSGRKIESDQFAIFRLSEDQLVTVKNSRIVNENWIRHFKRVISSIDEKFKRSSFVQELSGKLNVDEDNFLRYADNLIGALRERPVIQFKDGVKTTFTYVQVVKKRSALYEELVKRKIE